MSFSANLDNEKTLVNEVFQNAISQLNEDDQILPQITNILPLLRRGIGIHHSGLLPILKETIEILFQEGLLKVLFATETFSIGLNMPAKTVVFTKIEKFDGKELRHLSGGEYIQMSGRAGRRGLDDKGIVIMMVNQKIDVEKAKGMVKGEANALFSAFRLGYNMILNLSRVEGVSPEYLIRNSFRQFQNNAKLPQLTNQLVVMEDMYADQTIPDEDQIRTYYDARYTLDIYTVDFRNVISHPSYSIPFMQPGRLVYVVSNGNDLKWGVIINWSKRRNADGKPVEDPNDPRASAHNYILDIALLVDPAAVSDKVESLRAPVVADGASPDAVAESDKAALMVVVPVSLAAVASISAVRLNISKEWNMKDVDSKKALQRTFVEAKRRLFKQLGNVPVLDPVKDMGIVDKKFAELVTKIEKYTQLVNAHPLNSDPPRLRALYERYVAKIALSEKIKGLRKQIKGAEAIQQLDELKARKRILRRLGFTDERDVVQMKGRVACEISSGDPLLLTELLFNGVFNELSIEQSVALLGIFTFQERMGPNAPKPKLKPELAKPLQILQETAKRIATVSKEAKLEFDENDYLEGFKPDLMEVVYSWANGAKFSQLCKMTDVFEGNLVRSFRLLEELLKQMSNASRAIGNQDLEIKFTQGITKIKRDIVFANSLYL
jgi:ATP-dependent RNA helicase DOB1